MVALFQEVLHGIPNHVIGLVVVIGSIVRIAVVAVPFVVVIIERFEHFKMKVKKLARLGGLDNLVEGL